MRLALSFLTTLPVPQRATAPGDLGRAAAWFPAVGLVLGLLLTGGHWLAVEVLNLGLAGAVLVIGLWAALTGGLHLDGVADCGDGLLAAAPPTRRLEIMRDPRVGAFGVMALVLVLMLKAALVPAVGEYPSWHWPALEWPAAMALFPAGPFIVGPVVARWLLLLAARQPNARPSGLGAEMAANLSASGFVVAGVTTAAVIVLGGLTAVAAAAAAHGAAFLIFRVARARLGGVTGDVFGLTVEAAELAVLLGYAVLHGT
jgi:adenosylcobinamide-GDP ribazoletransferase